MCIEFGETSRDTLGASRRRRPRAARRGVAKASTRRALRAPLRSGQDPRRSGFFFKKSSIFQITISISNPLDSSYPYHRRTNILISTTFLIAIREKNEIKKLISVGFGGWIFFLTVVNLGGAVGLLPITGIVLPFVSYGSSAMISIFIALGIMYSRDYE